MQCPKCGYRLLPNDTACACCGTPRASSVPLAFSMPAPSVHCGGCGLKQDAGQRLCRNCGGTLPGFAPPFLATLPARIGLAAVVLVLLIVAVGWSVSAQEQAEDAAQRQREEAARQREMRLSQVLGQLNASNPGMAFARFPGDNGSVAISAHLSGCDVRALQFTHSEGSDSLSVNVSMVGSQKEPQAPEVDVSLYDEGGQRIARSPVVKFVDAELNQGETREVEDSLDYPKAAAPVFVGVDGGGHPAEAASSGAADASSSGASAGSAGKTEADYREAMGYYKQVCVDQGLVPLWPHDGDEDVLGVIFPDNAVGAETMEGKKELAKTVGTSFYDLRAENNRTGPCKAIVRFEPSDVVIEVTPHQ